ncbi:Ribonuclease, partial [Globisporangium splendens]
MFKKTTSLLLLCVAAATQFQSATAIDYLGGWLATPPKEQCVDICVNSKAAPTCPTSDPACLAKKQRPFDYDYLLLEQIFVPQFCRDLLKGVDSTISHQNVNPYPNGLTCKPSQAKTQLTIHGLWPNYNAGYAGCCNVSDTISNHPYNALEFAQAHTSLLAEMKDAWIDPTQANTYDTLCEIYNHEFQKHGICYGAFGDNWDQSAATYFRAALNVAATQYSATKKINTWATSTKPQTTLAAINALYPKNVQVLCSAVDGGNQLSAIRTCYQKPLVYSNKGPFYQIDCANATKSSATIPCDGTVPITLTKYTPPQ